MLLTRARHEGADQGSITTRPGIRASAAAALPSRSSSLRDGSRRTRKPQSSLRDFRASMPSFRLEVFRQHTLPRSSLPRGSYSPGYFRTVKESWSDVSELSPIQTSNSEGSTTQPLVAELQYWRLLARDLECHDLRLARRQTQALESLQFSYRSRCRTIFLMK